jgi:hypothetical protein
MMMQELKISTTLSINDQPLTKAPIDQFVDLEGVSSEAKIDMPKNTLEISICPNLAKDLLRLVYLKPVVLKEPTAPDVPAEEETPAASKAILKEKGFSFYTSQGKGTDLQKIEPIEIAQAKFWVEEQINLLFKGEEHTLLEKITFINPTGHRVRVYFIEGHNLSCSEHCELPAKK